MSTLPPVLAATNTITTKTTWPPLPRLSHADAPPAPRAASLLHTQPREAGREIDYKERGAYLFLDSHPLLSHLLTVVLFTPPTMAPAALIPAKRD